MKRHANKSTRSEREALLRQKAGIVVYGGTSTSATGTARSSIASTSPTASTIKGDPGEEYDSEFDNELDDYLINESNVGACLFIP